MRKALIPALIAVFAFSFVSVAAAGNAMPTGKVSVQYWAADLSESGSGTSTDAKQRFLPALTGVFTATKDINVIVKYAVSGKKAVSPADPPSNSKIKTTEGMIGGIYKLPMGSYASLAYGQRKLKISTDDNTDMAVTINGFRLGAGIIRDIPDSPLCATLDLGYGIGNKAKWSGAGVSTSPKANVFDLDAKLSYKIGKTGLAADAGYKYEKIKSKANSVINDETFKYDGPYIGATYSF